MRENRTCGSEGGEAQSLPYPYPAGAYYTAGETPRAPRASQAVLWFAGCGCAGQGL